MFYGKISLKSYCISKIKQIFNQKLLFCEIRACDSNSLCLEAPSLGVFTTQLVALNRVIIFRV